MRKISAILCFFLLILTTHAESACSGCKCTPDSDCACMSMPECINQEGTCTPEAHCSACYSEASCNCSDCSECDVDANGCCAPCCGSK